ncbi:MAG: hypothetical protein FK734_19265 [Asgard group archaeon]|nr:hypothetical protein [Asgard group archaeon]
MAIFKVVAQNFDLFDENITAQTGKITLYHLHKANASGVLIGHPDIKDNIKNIELKLKEIISLQNQYPNAVPYNVIMLGESFEEFSNNSLTEIAQLIKKRCSDIFQDIPDNFIKKALLIYEPKWDEKDVKGQEYHPPSPKLITRVTNKMRDFLIERLGPVGLNVSLMYGEVNSPERAVEVLSDINLQGLMLGASCKTPDQILEFIRAIQYVYDNRKIILVCNFKNYELKNSYQEYIEALAIVPDNFTIYFAPPATEIKTVLELIK